MAKTDPASKFPPENLENVKRELFGINGTEPATGGRFKPGQSGNPKGRPRRASEPTQSMGEQSIHAATVRAAMTPVLVRNSGASSSIPMFEAIIHAQMTIAAKGNPLAQRDALLRIERAHREVARELAATHEYWSRYRDQQWAEIERAKRNGAPLPNPLPHPDDLVIEPGQPVDVTGPIDEAEAARCAETCRLRDTLLLQHALDEKLQSTDPVDGYSAGGTLLWAIAFNKLVFERFQLSESQLIWQLLRNAAIPKRQLLKILHQTWPTLGYSVPRGTRFASYEFIAALFQFQGELIAAIRAGEIDPEAFARRDYNDVALGLMAKFKARVA